MLSNVFKSFFGIPLSGEEVATKKQKSWSSTKKGPGRKHYEPSDGKCRNDKSIAAGMNENARFESGAKLIRKAMNGTLTKRS